jgi:hypothetical protein
VQDRKYVPLFILVVVRRGEVEVAHHVARSFGRQRVALPAGLQVRLQALQQAEHACHPFVAGGQHLERCIEAGARRRVQLGGGLHRGGIMRCGPSPAP